MESDPERVEKQIVSAVVVNGVATRTYLGENDGDKRGENSVGDGLHVGSLCGVLFDGFKGGRRRNDCGRRTGAEKRA